MLLTIYPFAQGSMPLRAGWQKHGHMMVRAKSDLDRVEPLAKMNALSQRDLDAAKANYEASKSQLDVANAQLELPKLN